MLKVYLDIYRLGEGLLTKSLHREFLKIFSLVNVSIADPHPWKNYLWLSVFIGEFSPKASIGNIGYFHIVLSFISLFQLNSKEPICLVFKQIQFIPKTMSNNLPVHYKSKNMYSHMGICRRFLITFHLF